MKVKDWNACIIYSDVIVERLMGSGFCVEADTYNTFFKMRGISFTVFDCNGIVWRRYSTGLSWTSKMMKKKIDKIFERINRE